MDSRSSVRGGHLVGQRVLGSLPVQIFQILLGVLLENIIPLFLCVGIVHVHQLRIGNRNVSILVVRSLYRIEVS